MGPCLLPYPRLLLLRPSAAAPRCWWSPNTPRLLSVHANSAHAQIIFIARGELRFRSVTPHPFMGRFVGLVAELKMAMNRLDCSKSISKLKPAYSNHRRSVLVVPGVMWSNVCIASDICTAWLWSYFLAQHMYDTWHMYILWITQYLLHIQSVYEINSYLVSFPCRQIYTYVHTENLYKTSRSFSDRKSYTCAFQRHETNVHSIVLGRTRLASYYLYALLNLWMRGRSCYPGQNKAPNQVRHPEATCLLVPVCC